MWSGRRRSGSSYSESNVDPYSMMSDEYPVGSDPRNKENFRRLAAEVHKYGCKCITQAEITEDIIR